jgi:hypothetical protein
MTLVPLVQADTAPLPEDENSGRVEAFEVTVRIDEKEFNKQEKADSIRRWVKYMVLEVALELLDKSDFVLNHPDPDTMVLSVDSLTGDQSLRSFAFEFVELLRESTKYLAEDQSVLHFLSVMFLPEETG